jgi:tetratricopeptide (TPR) repeat protein
MVTAIVTGGFYLRARRTARTVSVDSYAGSSSCRGCHETFYQLWSTSHHGLAMQPYSAALARAAKLTGSPEIAIGSATYKAELSPTGGWIVERSAAGVHRYPIAHAVGGKNIYYFLTPLERGHLQVLPLAFDVRAGAWVDSTKGTVMHDNIPRDQAVNWRDRALTFNTACYGCHVSQVETNYDPADDSYRTTWGEPGINCESCHGPAGKHVRMFEAAKATGKLPLEAGLVTFRQVTTAQRNDSCGSCHAKASAITTGFQSGDNFFDRFQLTGLESADFFPDGRDSGENYTYTSWMMNPCAKSGELDCIHCHTSGGRYRFAAGDPNAACLPCHEERVRNASDHSHHRADSTGNRCISCHMPVTEYAHMRRSDHSLRAPTPAATLAYGSPNACNLCHQDRDANWADTQVRRWNADDYQRPALARAALIEAARHRDWSKLPGMFAYIQDPGHDAVFAASLLRLLATCPDQRKFAAARAALSDPSPMVRAGAVDLLAQHVDLETAPALAARAKDESRLVRIRAAAALSRAPGGALDAQTAWAIQPATQEYIASLRTRPDDYARLMELGSFYTDRQELQSAIAEYERAARLRPEFAPPLVNASVVYSRQGNLPKAEAALRRAIAAEPSQSVAHFDLGLLLAETGRRAEAEAELRKVLELDGTNASARYNLAVLIGAENPAEALALCRKAAELNPQDPKYQSAVNYFKARGTAQGTASRSR